MTDLSREEGSMLRQYGQLPYGRPNEWGRLGYPISADGEGPFIVPLPVRLPSTIETAEAIPDKLFDTFDREYRWATCLSEALLAKG
ncbi:hypothetical protein APSETT444_004977 [Aspergillus pseudonomiae]